jgi:MFS transporter, DHA2 family, multidrug resistance protein
METGSDLGFEITTGGTADEPVNLPLDCKHAHVSGHSGFTGAIGTAAVETFFTKREQFHSFIINGHVSLLEPATRERIADLQQYFLTHGAASTVDPQLLSGNLQQYSMAQGVAGAWHQAVIAVGNTIRAQATIMGYADCFALLGIVLIAAILPVALLRKGTGAGGTAH